jgi:hypothetical protein
MIADANTVALICSISRNTGNPAGPLPTIFIGTSMRTMLPLPAVVVKLGACRKHTIRHDFCRVVNYTQTRDGCQPSL